MGETSGRTDAGVPRARRSNLRPGLTSFVGREGERREVARLIETTRLVTLTGSGGSGKTRLACEVAAEVADAFAGGVWVVELESLQDATLVPEAIAGVAGAEDEPGLPALEVAAELLGSEETLLVLDNCEHVLEACADAAAELLVHAPTLRLLATSREPLAVPGETVWQVPPLSVPATGAEAEPETLEGYDAVRLFCERARLAQPGFALTAENAAAVTRICRGLDGVPLAIELAAGRLPLLQPEEIASRLDERLATVSAPVRGLPDRQRTLRAVMDWSYDLLPEGEQALFRRLGVFAGGFVLDSAAHVSELEPGEMLGLLDGLVRRSLVRAEDHGGHTRYRLLEVVRRYALERLEEAGEDAEAGARHARWCVSVAEEAEDALTGGEGEVERLAVLEAEHDNFRAALRWALGPGADPHLAQRLAGALARFWELGGNVAEGRAWLQAAVDGGGPPSPPRAKALLRAAVFARIQGDYPGSRRLAEEALRVVREIGDELGEASSLTALGGVAWSSGERARSLSTDSLALGRLLRQTRGITDSVSELGVLVWESGDRSDVRALHEQGLEIARRCGDERAEAESLLWLGNTDVAAGEPAGARARYEEALPRFRALGDRRRVADVLSNLALVAHAEGDPEGAAELHAESLGLRRQVGHRRGIAVSCLNLGELAHARGRPEEARALFEEASAIAEELGDEQIRLASAARLGEDGPEAASSSPDPGSVPAASAPAAEGALRREGEFWTLLFEDRTVRLKDSKGIRHLAQLLRHPHRELHVLDLVHAETPATGAGGGGADPAERLVVRADPFGDAGEVLDAEAKAAYRRRLTDLEEEIAEAESWGDPERASRATEEKQLLVDELASAVGLGGRDRRVSAASERARWSVSRSVKTAIRRIGEAHPSLGRHLETAVRTGVFCVYAPDPRAPIAWDIS